VAKRSRVLVLVFINWNLYKKKNLFVFSSQEGEVLALADSLYYMFRLFMVYALVAVC